MKLDYLDALRGMAILLVMLVHCANYGSYGDIAYDHWFKAATGFGAWGVQLFFMISAFTIALSFRQRKEKKKASVRNFFIRRFFRLAPVYYLAIVYFLWQNRLGPRWWTGFEKEIEIGNILANFAFTNWVNPYWINSLVPGGWSISVEASFYLLCPLLLLTIKNLRHAVNFTVLAFVAGNALTWYLQLHPAIENEWLWKAYLSLYFPAQLFVFGLGFIAYFLIIEKETKLSGSSIALLSLPPVYLLVSGNSPGLAVASFSLFLIILMCARLKPVLLVNRFTRHLGNVSYSCYVVHFIVLHWLSVAGFEGYLQGVLVHYEYAEYFIRLVLVVAVTVFVSNYSHRYIELPFIEKGRQFIACLDSRSLPRMANLARLRFMAHKPE